MRPASAKAKGRDGQKAFRDKLLEAFPVLEPDDIRSTPMGSPGEDLLLSPAARRVLKGIQVECKNCKKISIATWLAQAAEHGEHIPIVFFKLARGDNWAITMTPESFIELLRK